jgi:cell division protein FtsL
MLLGIARPLFVILLLCGLFGIVWLRSNIVSTEYAISELENKKTDVLRETKMLMAERASVLSMQKVEETAMKRLGLSFPERTRVVFVKKNKSGPQEVSLDISVETRKGLR